jgi:hypothetical protein
VAAAVPAVSALRKKLIEQTGADNALGALVTGAGPYRGPEVAAQIQIPLVGVLPEDRRSASALTHGGTIGFGRPLLRAAIESDHRIRRLAEARGRQAAQRALPGR